MTKDKKFLSNLVVRKAKIDDVDGIIKVARSVGKSNKNYRQGFLMDDYTKDSHRHRTNMAEKIKTIDYFYVAYHSEIIGFLIGYTRDQWLQLNNNWVKDVYWHPGFNKEKLNKFILIDKTAVHSNFTGMGIGSTIYETLFKDMKAEGINNIFAETLIAPTPNFASLEFRLKQEYQLCGFRYEDYNSRILSTLVYHKEIDL